MTDLLVPIRTIIFNNGGTPVIGQAGPDGNGVTIGLHTGSGDYGAFTPKDYGMTAPWKIVGGYLFVYQEGDGLVHDAGNDTWMTCDTTKMHIPGSSNPIDAASIIQANKLSEHNPFNGQNYSQVVGPVLFGSYYMTGNQVWLWTQPQLNAHCYVYAQIYVLDV